MHTQRGIWRVELSIEPEVDEAYFCFSVQQERLEGFEELEAYPTRIPVDASESIQEQTTAHIMDEVHSPLRQGEDISALCEQLSWIAPDWLEEENALSI